jgi:hypothetical protein
LCHGREGAAGFRRGEHERKSSPARRLDQVKVAATAWNAEKHPSSDVTQTPDDHIREDWHGANIVLRYHQRS